jgi:hypothetical protein
MFVAFTNFQHRHFFTFLFVSLAVSKYKDSFFYTEHPHLGLWPFLYLHVRHSVMEIVAISAVVAIFLFTTSERLNNDRSHSRFLQKYQFT